MRICKKVGSLVLVLALAASLALSLVPLRAQAAYESSGDGDVRLTIRYNPGVEARDSATIERQGYRLYLIATVNETGDGYVLTEQYKNLVGTRIPTTMKPNNAYSGINWDLVQRTGEYINETSPEPSFAAPIVNGEAVFTNLPRGLYLGTGPACYINGKLSTPVPFVVSLPYLVDDAQLAPEGVEAGVYYTDVTVSPKFNTPTGGGSHHHKDPDPKPDPDPNPDPNPDPDPPPDPPVDIPDEPVPLVDIPDDPVPLVDIPDDPTPLVDIPDEPVPTTTKTPQNSNTPKKSNTTTIKDDPVPLARLPQTGLLWWPVPVLAVAGVALTSAGLVGRRKAE